MKKLEIATSMEDKKKNLPQKCISFIQRPRRGANQIENVGTIKTPLPPDTTEKTVAPTSTATSKGQIGNLDFHPHEATLRNPNTATKVVSEAKWETQTFTPAG